MKDDLGNTELNTLSEDFAHSTRRLVAFDLQKYQTHLDEMGISGEQKEQFLRAMFSIVMTFVDLGFEVHPLQEVCGKDELDANRQTQRAIDGVRSEKSQHSLNKPESGPSGSLERK